MYSYDTRIIYLHDSMLVLSERDGVYMMLKFMKNSTARLALASLGMSLLLSACGQKSETISDIENDTEVISATEVTTEDSTEDSTEKVTENNLDNSSGDAVHEMDSQMSVGISKNGKLSDKLGGTELSFSKEFTVGDTPVSMNIDYQVPDKDEIPICKVTKLTEEDVHEEEIVKNLLGETAVALKDKDVLDPEEGDSDRISNYVSSILALTTNNGVYQGSAAWYEDADLFLHTYEGTKDGIAYQLMVGYDRKNNEKYVVFYPKNMGDIVGDSSLDKFGYTCTDGYYYYWDVRGQREIPFDMKTILADKENSCKLDKDELSNIVKSTMHDQLYIDIPENNIWFVHTKDENADKNDLKKAEKSDLIFFNSNEINEDNPEFPTAVINGSYGLFSNVINDFWIIPNADKLSAYSDIDRGGEFLVNDTGVVGFYIATKYNYSDIELDNTDLLSFEDAMNAFEKGISENLDTSELRVPMKNIDFTTMRLMYYPVPVSEGSNECHMIPVWVGDVDSPSSAPTADPEVRGIINAIDGSFIKILYYRNQ